MPAYVVAPDTQIALPGGGGVSAGFLADQGATGYTRDPSGSILAPSDATAVGFGGGLYPLSNNYDWAPQYQTKPPGQDGGTNQGNTNANQNALSVIQGALDAYGLPASLAPWAYDLLTQGYDSAYILQQLRERPEFNDRFPAIKLRQQAGLPAISPAEYVSLEKTYDGYMKSAGIDGFFDRNTLYTKWIAGDVSPPEAKARADEAYQGAMGEPIEDRNEMTRLFGVGAGAAAIAYYLDPTNVLPKLQTQLQAGQIAGQAVRSTYSLLTADEATQLAQLGVTGTQARQGFADLTNQQQLFQNLPGQADFQIDQNQQLAAEFEGNAQVQRQVQQVADQRKAEFAGSSGYRVTSLGNGEHGLAGAGVANT